MTKKQGIDAIVAGFLISVLVFPKFRDALMTSFFCNDFIERGTDSVLSLFGGSCNYGFIILFVIPGIYTAFNVLQYFAKFLGWLQKFRA